MSTLNAYLTLARERPDLFRNPDGAPFQILLERKAMQQAESEAARKLATDGFDQRWASVGIVFQDLFGMIVRDAVIFPDTSVGILRRFVGANKGIPGAAALPVEGTEVVLLEHFRHSTRTWQLEIPRGLGEVGMSLVEVAQMEIQEEIGARVTRVVPLGSMHPDTGASAWQVALFFAEIEASGKAATREGIRTLRKVSISQLESLIRGGGITDSFTLSAFAMARLQGLI